MNFAGKWREPMNIILCEVTKSQNEPYGICIYLQVDISHKTHISYTLHRLKEVKEEGRLKAESS